MPVTFGGVGGGTNGLNSTERLTESCFLFLPKNYAASPNPTGDGKEEEESMLRATRRKRRKVATRSTAVSAPICSDFAETLYEEETDASVQHRHQNYLQCCEFLDAKVKAVRDRLNQAVFLELSEWLSEVTEKNSHNRHLRGFSRAFQEVSTAVLYSGVNVSDHLLILETMCAHFKGCCDVKIVRLRSRDCSSLKLTLKQLITQIFSPDQDAKIQNGLPKHANQPEGPAEPQEDFLEQMTLESVEKLYETKYGKRGKNPPPIVIVVEDFEGFEASIMEDLIIICSGHSLNLCISFLFCVATHGDVLQRKLSRSALSVLQTRKFHIQQSSVYLTGILEEIMNVESGCLFTFSQSLFTFLVDQFLFEHFSVTCFLQSLKYALLEHFYENPLSCFHNVDFVKICCQNSPEEALDWLQKSNLSHASLWEMFRATRSFRDFIESQGENPELQKNLLLQDDLLMNHLIEFIRHYWHQQKCYHLVIKVFHHLICKLPENLFGKHVRELYCQLLNVSIDSLPHYRKAIDLARFLSQEDVLELIQYTTCLFEGFEEFSPFLSLLKTTQTRMMESSREQLSTFPSQPHHSANGDTPTMAPAVGTPTKLVQSELMALNPALSGSSKKLLRNRSLLLATMTPTQVKDAQPRTPQKRCLWDQLCVEVLQCFDGLFVKYLKDFSALCGNEIFCIVPNAEFEKKIIGKPRICVQRALSKPFMYCSSKNWDNRKVLLKATLPDTCIAYHLYSECGRLINLYDWLQAFSFVIRQDPHGKKTQLTDEVCQARFIRAASELQIMGFIKPTKQKTDHVQRLTWGECF